MSPLEPKQKATVLIVASSAIVRQIVGTVLRIAYECSEVADGQEALARARIRRPDLIIADLRMQGMDGLAFLRRLRSDPGPTLSKIPVIMLVMAKADSAVCIQSGANACAETITATRVLRTLVKEHLQHEELSMARNGRP